ncbi:hypothetical protein [Dysgonomonas reticulitermitis]
MKKEISAEEAIQKMREVRNPEEFIEQLSNQSAISLEEALEQVQKTREWQDKNKAIRVLKLEFFQLARLLNRDFRDILAEKKLILEEIQVHVRLCLLTLRLLK